jgi:two-component system response regulator NreC
VNGERVVDPELAAQALSEGDSPLSSREAEVLRMIALGHTNVEIAEQLYLSIRTVESHRAHIQQKLRRSSRADLVRYAIDHGLVEL